MNVVRAGEKTEVLMAEGIGPEGETNLRCMMHFVNDPFCGVADWKTDDGSKHGD